MAKVADLKAQVDELKKTLQGAVEKKEKVEAEAKAC